MKCIEVNATGPENTLRQDSPGCRNCAFAVLPWLLSIEQFENRPLNCPCATSIGPSRCVVRSDGLQGKAPELSSARQF